MPTPKNTYLNRSLWNGVRTFAANPAGDKAIPLLIIIAGFAATLALNLPGQLSYDSVIQLLDGRTGAYHAWHPPVMAWLLGLGDAVLPGTALYVAVNSAVAFLSFGSLLWLKQRTGWVTVLVALIAVLTPQFLLYQGIVWKDVLFANAAISGFVLLAHAARHWPRPVTRFVLLATAALAFCVAGLARQNGVIAPAAGAMALAWIAAKQAPGAQFKWGVLYGLAGLAILAACLGGGAWALGQRTIKDGGTSAQITLLQAYDLIGAIKYDSAYPLDYIDAHSPLLAAQLRNDGVRLYSSLKNDTLEESPSLDKALNDPSAAPIITAQWRNLILTRPILYIRVRSEVFREVFLTPDIRQCTPYYVGVDGPQEEMGELGLVRRWRPRDQMLADYAQRFLGTPIFSHAAFAVAAVLILIALVRRRRPSDIAIGGMLVCVGLFVLSFFAISIACDYRYLYALDAATIYALFYLV